MPFAPCLSILPPAQQALWSALRPAADLGFVLYGGTAIALRLGHRFSVDFDFFSELPLDREALRAVFPFMENATILQDERHTFCVLVPFKDKNPPYVKVSFFGKIGFGRVGTPDVTQDGILQVASLEDLMATKMKVILQRAELKDYQDIVAMIKAGVDLARGLSAASQIFGQNFQPSESLKALVYFDDGDLKGLENQQKEILIRTVQGVSELPNVPILSTKLKGPS